MKRIIVLMLGVAAAIGAWSAAGSAQAQGDPLPDTSRRIQLYIVRVHVLDDSDDLTWGELTYRFRLQRGSQACAGFWCTGTQAAGNLFIDSHSESATTTQQRPVRKLLGGANGMALYPTDQMRVSFAGVEEDWDGPGVAFCPVAPWYEFNDRMCGAHDRLGMVDLVFTGPGYGIGAHSQTVTNADGHATFRVDYEIRNVASVTSGIGGATPTPRPPTPRPEPTSIPTARPGMPPRHEP